MERGVIHLVRLRSQIFSCATSRHGDNTWVTVGGQDMGDTFGLKDAVLCGHAVARPICCWGAAALGRSSAPGRKVVDSLVPDVWRQPQDGLQVEGPFSARRV